MADTWAVPFQTVHPVPSDDVAVQMLASKAEVANASDVEFLESFADLPPEGQGAEKDNGSLVERVARDVGRGLTEAPKQIVGGALDAYEAALNGIAEFDQWASEGLGLGKVQFLNDKGEFDLDWLSAEEAGKAKAYVPQIAEPETTTGSMVRGLSQFLTGFVAGGRIVKGAGVMAGPGKMVVGGRAAAASAISDFAAFDGHEARLSDLVQSFPELQNPVTEYLASNKDDGELEGRLKNVLEGAGADAMIGGLVVALRSIRNARKARVGEETYAQAAERLARDPKSIAPPEPIKAQVLTDKPLFERRPVSSGQDASEATAKNGRAGGADSPADEGAAAPLIRPKHVGDVSEVSRSVDEVGAEDAANSLLRSRIETDQGDMYVNWSRIETVEDVKSVIQQMADVGKDEIDVARRGVVSNAETHLSADKENAWELLSERRHGQPMNASQTLALRRLWAASGEKLTSAARAVRENPNVENQFLFRRAVALHGAIQREVMAVRTETARALQQWSIPAGAPENVARQVSETIDIFGGAGVNTKLADMILDKVEQGNFAAVDSLTRRSGMAQTFDMLHEYWINAILSGPKTHMVNAMSNAMVAMLSQVERLGAGLIGQAVGGVDRIELGEGAAMLHGMLSSVPDAFRYMGDAFRTGQSGYGMQKIEGPRLRAISSETLGNSSASIYRNIVNRPVTAAGINAIGGVVNLPGKALGASDEFFKTINYRMEIHALAVRNAMEELRAGQIVEGDLRGRIAELVADPPEAAMVMAREFAQYNTFTNSPGEFTRQLIKLKANDPTGVLRFILPFTNTPANIARFAAERSPAAPLLAGFRADVRAGGSRAHMAISRMGLGSMAILAGFDAALNGSVTGGGPADYRQRQSLQRTGWQPYSIRFGDRYYAYNRLDPIGMQLSVAANLAEMAMAGGDAFGDDLDEVIYTIMASVGQSMMDKTYLRGLSDLFEAMANPKQFAASYFERLGASLVPAVVREVETVVDPTLRRASDTLELMRTKVPGLSGDLPARHDLWGREIDFRSGHGWVYDALSPIYASRYDPEPIDEEFQRIGYFPALPSRTLVVDGKRHSLRNYPAVYEEFVVLQGDTKASAFERQLTKSGAPTASSRRMAGYGERTLLQTLNDLVEGRDPMSAAYADADEEGKAGVVKTIISDYRGHARAKLVADHPEVFGAGGAHE